MNGVIKNVISNRNYGFIREEDTLIEYFFHKEDFQGHWEDLELDFGNGAKIPVTFESADSGKGPRAANVRRTDFPNEG